MKCQPKSLDVINAEIFIVRQMILDERWYEGERQHHEVSDREVEDKINKLVMENGHRMREETVNRLINEMCRKMDHDCENCPYKIVEK